jgi:hypothetical protein
MSLPEFTPLADGVNTPVAPVRLFGRICPAVESASWAAPAMSIDSVWIGFLPGLADRFPPDETVAGMDGGSKTSGG